MVWLPNRLSDVVRINAGDAWDVSAALERRLPREPSAGARARLVTADALMNCGEHHSGEVPRYAPLMRHRGFNTVHLLPRLAPAALGAPAPADGRSR
jgi:hypothetical protein